MSKILTQTFFARPAPQVAKDLLGKYVVRKSKNKKTVYKITETEAYEGVEDLTSHASNKVLEIDKSFNTLETLPKNNLWFEDREEFMVGVEYAGPIWSKKKYRFIYNISQ